MGLKIKAELGGDGTGFERMMTKAGVTANNFANSSIAPLKNMIAGAFSVGAIASLTRGTIEYASHLRDLSDELGVNVEWLQEMQFVAKQSGANVDDLERVMRKLAQARAEALSAGGGKQLAAFQKFGIGVGEIQSGKITDIVDKIAKAFENGNQQELIPAFQAIGGKGAAVMIPAFLDGLAAGRAAARAAGAVITDDVIDQLDEIDDAMARFKLMMTGGLAPVIVNITHLFRKMTDRITEMGAYLYAFFRSLDWDKLLFGHGKGKGFVTAIQEADAKARPIAQAQADDNATAEQARIDELAKKKDARHKREIQKIDISPLEAPAERFQFARNSDALTSVGNFLGGTGAAADLVSVGEKTNRLLQDANTHLGNIATNTTRSGGGSGVPEE